VLVFRVVTSHSIYHGKNMIAGEMFTEYNYTVLIFSCKTYQWQRINS